MPSCLVDTTLIEISPPYICPWEYYNKDKHKYGLLYQITCSLGKPFRFLAVHGPFKGAAADVSIFRTTLVPYLSRGEKVMTDRGYWQETQFAWSPPTGDISTLSTAQKIERRKVTRIRHLNERLIERLKNWALFTEKWTGSWKFQTDCFFVCTKLTNLSVCYFPLK